MQWSPEQSRALTMVSNWIKDPNGDQVFKLMGYAGTGKTTLAKHLADGMKGVYFAAYTGKAAHVLRTKGCRNASTIHGLIYMLDPDSPVNDPIFILNEESPLTHAKLLIVDEVSMVDGDIGKDLLSFGCKILVLGDPAQLPPIAGAGFFTKGTPDIVLTEIHRQAQDNPILAIATMIRNGKPPKAGDYGDSKVIAKVEPDKVVAADQILVGTNKLRLNINSFIRQHYGYNKQSDFPLAGEKIVCLRNNHPEKLMNGALYFVDEQLSIGPSEIDLSIYADFDSAISAQKVSCYPEYFQKETPTGEAYRRLNHFDFGYALTVHKAQGSEWDDVVVYDQSFIFRQDRWKWLYTAVTRASKRITIVRN
jgi:exodeoxyribonuclease-5